MSEITSQVPQPSELTANTETVSADLVQQVQDLFAHGVDTTHVMDGFDDEDLEAATDFVKRHPGLFTTDFHKGLVEILERKGLSYTGAIEEINRGVRQYKSSSDMLRSFDEFKTARMHARGRREDQRWGSVHQRIGQDITDQGYAIEYWMRPPIEPDQMDWLGRLYDPPLDPISTSKMRVYWCRSAVAESLLKYQNEAATPVSLPELKGRLRPSFYHTEIGDLNRRPDQRLEGVEIRLPADAIVLHEELMQLSMSGDLIQISSQAAQMANQIRDRILTHAVDSLSEVRSFFPSGETQ